jgi:opacity protein-like surface antigen
MYVRENNPTGFDKGFAWQGGFHQLNYQISPKAVVYGRYDWVKGNLYDDTSSLVNGVFGQTKTRPSEYDVVAGLQYTIASNVKLVGEYRLHEFKDTAGTPNTSSLRDSGFTTRIMIGF